VALLGSPGSPRKVADLYDMIHPNADNTLTVRSVFVIGPDKKVKLTLTYPASAGRNFDEVLRVIDSLQLTADKQLATPADWKAGQDVIIAPSVSDDEARSRFGDFVAVKPLPAHHPRLEGLTDSHLTRRHSPTDLASVCIRYSVRRLASSFKRSGIKATATASRGS